MARHPENPTARGRSSSRRLAASGKRRRGFARTLAQGTLFAAGIAAAQFSPPETDSKFHLFDPTLLDRLRAPITRYHE